MLVPSDEEWANSKWLFLKRPSPKVFGGLVEDAVQDWLGASSRASSDHDIRLGSMRIEIKAATSNRGKFIFNQIRADQDYSHALLVGFTPTDARAWLMTKDAALAASKPQHARSAGIRVLIFALDDPPASARPRDGSLAGLRVMLPGSEAFPFA